MYHRRSFRYNLARLTALLGLLALLGTTVPGSSTAQETPAPLAATSKLYLPLIKGTLGAGVPAGGYIETFDGSPDSPQPWQPTNWDVSVHSRDVDTWDALESMEARHGADCGAPPATHPISSYKDAVFQCRNHMMTAIKASGYGVIYLTPNQLLDFSQGESLVRFDLSTLRTSGRDYVDVWITPYADNLQLTFEDAAVDLSGPPRNAVQVRMDFGNNTFKAIIYRNFQPTSVESASAGVAYESFLTPDAARRDTFELRLSRTHISFGMPGYNFRWVDAAIPDLGWSQGVVQLGHHSYNPLKDCDEPCSANTWHWDNVIVAPARPFTILRADRTFVDSTITAAVGFPQAAPANAHLRFAGIGNKLEVSFDGGATWRAAELQAQDPSFVKEEHFKSYWMPIPAGTQQVRFRGQAWWAADWRIRDITVWAPPTP